MGTSEYCVAINTFPLLLDTRERVVFRGLWWYFIMSVSRVASEFRTTPATNAPRNLHAESHRDPLDTLDAALIVHLQQHPERLAHTFKILLDHPSTVDIISSTPDNIDFWPGIILARLCYRKMMSQHRAACHAAIESGLYHTSTESILAEGGTSAVDAEEAIKEIRRIWELEMIAFLQGTGRFIHLVQAIRRSDTSPADPQLRRGVQQFLSDMDVDRRGVRAAVAHLREESPQGGEFLQFLIRYENALSVSGES